MEHKLLKIMKSKEAFTNDDINMLIVLCERLFNRNDEIALELGEALQNIESLTRRIDFYRNTTMKGVK